VTKQLVALLMLLFTGAPAAQDSFNNPDRVCAVLEPEGLSTGGWKAVAYGYQCSTKGQARASAPPDSLASFIADGSISYTASGDDDRRVRRIKLILRLVPGEESSRRKEEFFRVATILGERLRRRMPSNLRQLIYEEKEYREAAPAGNFTLDPGLPPHTELVLILRDPSVRVVPIPRRL
jgi:hypothetical protein